MKDETDITIAHIALSRDKDMSIGENRKDIRKEAKLVALKVRSVETEGFFIEQEEEIALGSFSIVGITPAIVGSASVPRLKEPEGLKIDFHPVQSLGIVRTRDKKLILAVIGDKEVTLPPDTELVGVVAAPVGAFEVTAYDSLTKQNNKLGYHFTGTVPGTWTDLALRKREAAQEEKRRRQEEIENERRQAAERAEQEAKAAQMKREADAQPVEMFTTSDPEVADRLREAYRPALISIKKVGVKYFVEDYEDRGKEIAASVQNERAELRRQNADPDKVFAKRREERAEILAGRNS
jgi:hypothetical protein